MYVLATESVPVVSTMEKMLSTMESVVSFATDIFGTITSNAVLSFIVAGSLVGVGIHVLRLIKNAAR